MEPQLWPELGLELELEPGLELEPQLGLELELEPELVLEPSLLVEAPRTPQQLVEHCDCRQSHWPGSPWSDLRL